MIHLSIYIISMTKKSKLLLDFIYLLSQSLSTATSFSSGLGALDEIKLSIKCTKNIYWKNKSYLSRKPLVRNKVCSTKRRRISYIVKYVFEHYIFIQVARLADSNKHGYIGMHCTIIVGNIALRKAGHGGFFERMASDVSLSTQVMATVDILETIETVPFTITIWLM